MGASCALRCRLPKATAESCLWAQSSELCERVSRLPLSTLMNAHHKDLGIDAQWNENFDVAVLATFMGVPKEGPSAGITIVTGIVSALTGKPVRNELAMTGEITILGKVLPVGGIQQKIRAAYDAGINEVLLPADNLPEAQNLPSYILDTFRLTPVRSIGEVLQVAFAS